jgi:antiviral defense system Shedu protein SduA
MSVDLTIIRSNLHGYLGREDSNVHEVSFIPAYEREALQNIRKNFRDLLDNGAPEEVIQKFIEENPVLLHPFSPKDLWFKAPVLTFCKTDFAILSHASELLLIELEKPQTRILKKDGGVHSELQHAFDQVRDWLHLADEHRQAFVECIGAEPKQVGAVKGTVIAGRDAGCNPNHLRKLKGADLGRTKFMTYDDLFASFEALLRALDKT